MRHYLPLTFTLFVFAMWGCGPSGRQADLKDIEAQVSFDDMTQALAEANFNDLNSTHQELYQRFGSFWRDYTEFILQVGPAEDPSTLIGLQGFLDYQDTQNTEEAIREVHGHRMAGYNEAIDFAFRRFHYFFPETALPEVIYFNSGFNFSVFPTDTHLGIGLDYFLGADHPITQQLNPELFPGFMRAKMEPDLLVAEALRGWLLVHHQDAHYDESNLVSTCIYWGKMMYILDLMLPDAPDHIKMSYTPEEQAWNEKNERNLWIEFSNQEILYETRRFEINRWIVDGPFTRAAGVPQEAPSRVGIWLGWRIVRDYMDRNPELTPAELLNNRAYLRMLNAYRPG